MNSTGELINPINKEECKVWFFPGADNWDTRFNKFTSSFINLMNQIFEDDFQFIKGIYYKSTMLNVIWALNNAQKPVSNPENEKLISEALNMIVSAGISPDTQLIITSSSSGTIVAAQTACYLAGKNRNNVYLHKPFHVILRASMLSEKSELFKQLVHYQKEGLIGKIIHEEVQFEGDTSFGVGGITKMEAYSNAFGLICPCLSKKYNGPSFLNTHPEKGHIHRKRSQMSNLAQEFIDIILIKYKLAGEYYRGRAESVLANEIR